MGSRATRTRSASTYTRAERCGNSNRSANASVTPNLPTRSAVRASGEPKKPRDRTDTSDTCAHAQDLANNSRRSTNKPECVRTPKGGCTKSNSPGTSPERAQQSQRPGDHTNALGTGTGTHSYRFDMKTAARTRKDVSIPQNKTKWPNSPNGTETRCRDEADGWGEPRGWVDSACRHAER